MESDRSSSNTNTYQVMNFGALEAWSTFVLAHPKLGPVPGKQFLASELGLTGMEVSLNSLAPGKDVPFLHGHRQNEELYLFLTGSGQMMLDDRVVAVSAGTAVRVAPPVLRSWRNTGTEPLTCIVIQAKQGSLSQATAKDGFVGAAPPVWPPHPDC